MTNLKSFIVVLVITTLFSGCGYTPSSKFARVVVGDKISTSVILSAIDPENTVAIKDAVDMAVLEVFHASLTTRNSLDTHLELALANPSYSAVEYDENGFIIAYRAKITLSIREIKGSKVSSYSASGSYDFAIAPNAIVTDQQRYDAIKYGSIKAIKSYLAQVSSKGARESKNEQEREL